MKNYTGGYQIIDCGGLDLTDSNEQTITGFDYLPRMEEGAPGSIKDYKIFVY